MGVEREEEEEEHEQFRPHRSTMVGMGPIPILSSGISTTVLSGVV